MDNIELKPTDDRHALERSLESFRAYLLFVAWRLKGNQTAGPEGPSDLVQRTMMAAMRNIREGNVPGESIAHRKAWLRRILFNTVNHAVRSERAEKRGGGRITTDLDHAGPDSTTSPSSDAIKNEERALLANALARLEPDVRELITWRYLDGLTCDEIGRRRGCSASYISRVCNEIIDRLRRSLDT
jgi:RNA polymerase sigma factor (sigma-70 family)